MTSSSTESQSLLPRLLLLTSIPLKASSEVESLRSSSSADKLSTALSIGNTNSNSSSSINISISNNADKNTNGKSNSNTSTIIKKDFDDDFQEIDSGSGSSSSVTFHSPHSSINTNISNSSSNGSSTSTSSTLLLSVPRSSFVNNPTESECNSRSAPMNMTPSIRSALHSSCSSVTSITSNQTVNAAPPSIRSSKRSSSSSNDLLYERDRFRARLQTFNNTVEGTVSSCDPLLEDDIDLDSPACDVCDGIGFKTAKLNFNHLPSLGYRDYTNFEAESVSPLDASSKFYSRLQDYAVAQNISSAIIKSVSIPHLKHIFLWYFNKPLPNTNDMFPWLHGLNKDNFAQKSFFLYQQQQLQQKLAKKSLANIPNAPVPAPSQPDNIFHDYNLEKPKNIRFLMCINFGEEDSNHEVVLRNTVKLNEILQRIEVSRIEVRNTIGDILKKIDIDTNAEVLVQDCIKLNCLPIFLDLDPDRGISLRNFHIQVSKLSTCSDFLLYGQNADHDLVESMSRVLWLAQRYEAFLRHDNVTHYNVFVLDDDIGQLSSSISSPASMTNLSKLESKYLWDKYQQFQQLLQHHGPPKIVTQKTEYPALVWDNDYQIKEKIETTRMSSATKLNNNVWVGNYWDFQIMMTYLLENDSSFLESRFQKQFSLLPLKNLYCNPENSIVTNTNLSNNLLDYLSLPRANWRLFIYCHNDATFPDLSNLSSLLFKYTISSRLPDDFEQPEYHILEFPPSGAIGIGDCKKDNLMSIINTCKLIYLYSSSSSTNALASLIYCSDGYTELSLLVLCYLMYAENLSLDNAMLELHLKYGRPFYIFNSDVLILKKLESLLRKFSPANPANNDIAWATLDSLTNLEINELLLGSSQMKNSKTLKLGYIENDEDSSSSSSSDDDDDFIPTPVDWVKEVEGSIPSKILPYLYLGSLKHANCLALLNKLGIKKILSVGEQLDWLNGYKFQEHNDIIVDEINGGSIEMYTISPSTPPHKNKQHSAYHHTTIDTVMKVNNLEDDGIDELTRALPTILQFIDDEYKKSNGKTKILIHCRVGVSRSATVVIAEVMRRLKVNLPNAYLYVRVRRLNIIIQPNLRFMYELFKWEELQKLLAKEKGDENEKTEYLREIDWFIMCREIMKLNIPYLNN